MDESPVAVVLDRLAERVRQSGLVQRFDALDRLGRPCSAFEPRAARLGLTPSLLLAAKDADGDTFLGALYALAEAIGIANHRDHNTVLAQVWEWEDEPSRIVDDVLDAITRAREAVA